MRIPTLIFAIFISSSMFSKSQFKFASSGYSDSILANDISDSHNERVNYDFDLINDSLIVESVSDSSSHTSVSKVDIAGHLFELRYIGQSIDSNSASRRKSKLKPIYFEGHLSSLHIGINGYANKNDKNVLVNDYQFMNLIHQKSVEVAIYPWQKSFRLIGSHTGFVSSLGLLYNNYRFDLDSPSQLNEVARDWFPAFPENAALGKSKMTLLFLSLPLLLEVQIPDNRTKEKLYFSAGVCGDLLLSSHTKTIVYSEGNKTKRKKRDDFNLNGLRYTYIARAGYSNIGIYATYSPVSLFKSNYEPTLYPYSVGVTFNLN